MTMMSSIKYNHIHIYICIDTWFSQWSHEVHAVISTEKTIEEA